MSGMLSPTKTQYGVGLINGTTPERSITPLSEVDYSYRSTPKRLLESYGVPVKEDFWEEDDQLSSGASFSSMSSMSGVLSPTKRRLAGTAAYRRGGSRASAGSNNETDAWEEITRSCVGKALFSRDFEPAARGEVEALLRALHLPPWEVDKAGLSGPFLVEALRTCVAICLTGKTLKSALQIMSNPLQEGGGLDAEHIVAILKALDVMDVEGRAALTLIQQLDTMGPHPNQWAEILQHMATSGCTGHDALTTLGAAMEAGIPGEQLCGVLRALAEGGVKNTAAVLRAVHLLRPGKAIDTWFEIIVEMKMPAGVVEEVAEMLVTAGANISGLLETALEKGGDIPGAAALIARAFRAIHQSSADSVAEAVEHLAELGVRSSILMKVVQKRANALEAAGLAPEMKEGAMEAMSGAGVKLTALIQVLGAMAAAGIAGEAVGDTLDALKDLEIPGKHWAAVVGALSSPGHTAPPADTLKALKAAGLSSKQALRIIELGPGHTGNVEVLQAAGLSAEQIVKASNHLHEVGLDGAMATRMVEALCKQNGMTGQPLVACFALFAKCQVAGEPLLKAIRALVAAGLEGGTLVDFLFMLLDGGLVSGSFLRAIEALTAGPRTGEDAGGLPVGVEVVHRGGMGDDAESLEVLGGAGLGHKEALVNLVMTRCKLFSGLGLTDAKVELQVLLLTSAMGAYAARANDVLAALMRIGMHGEQVQAALESLLTLGISDPSDILAIVDAFAREAPHAEAKELVSLLAALVGDEACRGRTEVIKRIQMADISSKHEFSTNKRYAFGMGSEEDGTSTRPLVLLGKARAVVIGIKAAADCIVGFFPGPEDTHGPMYEVVIGGWGNSASEIRRGKMQRPCLAAADTPNALSALEMRYFWAEARGGRVRVGKGAVLGKEVFMSYDDPAPLAVTHFGATTGFAFRGEWEITVVDDVPAGLYLGGWMVEVAAATEEEPKPASVDSAATAVTQHLAAPLSFQDRQELSAALPVGDAAFVLRATSYVRAAAAGTHHFSFSSSGGAGRVEVNGSPAIEGVGKASLDLPSGYFPVVVTFAAPGKAEVAFKLSSFAEGSLEAFDDTLFAETKDHPAPPNLRASYNVLVVDRYPYPSFPNFGASKSAKRQLYSGPISFRTREEVAAIFGTGPELHALQLSGVVHCPADGEYTFFSASDDGSKVYIDGELIVDNSGLHPTRTRKGTVHMAAGDHALTVGFFNHRGASVLHVYAVGPEQEHQVVTVPSWTPSTAPPEADAPVMIIDRYLTPSTPNFKVLALFEPVRKEQYEGEIEFRSAHDFMHPPFSLGKEMYAVQFCTTLIIEEGMAGTYTFFTTSDDGTQLWVNDELVVENGGLHPARSASSSVTLEAGSYTVRVPFFNHRGHSVCKAYVRGPGLRKLPLTCPSWSAAGASNAGWPSALVKTRFLRASMPDFDSEEMFDALEADFEGPVDFDNREQFNRAFRCGLEYFAIQLTSTMEVDEAHAGEYTFWVGSDDGAVLFVDDAPLVNNAGLHGLVWKSASITLAAGRHTVRVPFFNHRGHAVLKVFLKGPGVRRGALTVPAWSGADAPQAATVLLQTNYRTAVVPDFASLLGAVGKGYEGALDFPSAQSLDEKFQCGLVMFAFEFTTEVTVETGGRFTFWTNSDDGSELWVEDARVVNNGGTHGMRSVHGTITLTPGKYTVRVPFFNHGGPAGLQVHVRGPGVRRQLLTVPSWAPPAASEMNWSPALVMTNYRAVRMPDFDSEALMHAVDHPYEGAVSFSSREWMHHYLRTGFEYFAVQFVSTVVVTAALAGEYTFWLTSDDGSMLYLDEELVINNDGLHAPRTRVGKATLAEGEHTVRVPMYQHRGLAVLQVHVLGPGIRKTALTVPRWAPAEAPVDATVLVQNNYTHRNIPDFNLLPTAEGRDFEGPINFPSAQALHSKFGAGLELFAYEFTTTLEVEEGHAGRYTFSTTSDDGSELWVGAHRVVNNGGLHGMRTQFGQITLAAGSHAVRVPFFNHRGPAGLLVHVRGPTSNRQFLTCPKWSAAEAAEQGWPAAMSLNRFLLRTTPDFNHDSMFGAEEAAYDGPILFPSAGHFSRVFGNGPELFAVQLTSKVEVEEGAAGEYTFWSGSDDGSQVFVDDKLVVNNDGLHPLRTLSASVLLSAGTHTVRVAFFNHRGPCCLFVYLAGPGTRKCPLTVPAWSTASAPKATAVLIQKQFEGIPHMPDFAALPKAEGRDFSGPISFPSAQGLSAEFQCGITTFALEFRCILTVSAEMAGRYTFATNSDDGSEVWVGESRIVNNGGHHGPRDARGAINLSAGKHEVRIPYWQGHGPCCIHAYITGPGFPQTVLTVPSFDAAAAKAEEVARVAEAKRIAEEKAAAIAAAIAEATAPGWALPPEGLLMHFDARSGAGEVGSEVEEWAAATPGLPVTSMVAMPLVGKPLVVASKHGPSVRFGFNRSARLEPPLASPVQTIVSFHKFEVNDKPHQVYILTGSSPSPLQCDSEIMAGGKASPAFTEGTISVDGRSSDVHRTKIWRDGFKTAVCQLREAVPESDPAARIGWVGRDSKTNGSFSGSVCELIAYDRALSEVEVAALEAYFTAKWSPPKPPGFKSAFVRVGPIAEHSWAAYDELLPESMAEGIGEAWCSLVLAYRVGAGGGHRILIKSAKIILGDGEERVLPDINATDRTNTPIKWYNTKAISPAKLKGARVKAQVMDQGWGNRKGCIFMMVEWPSNINHQSRMD